ncbi:MAG TPA: hypothetical protein VH352_15525 [Pseudonocardiaceae bacterium]|nr:hypothetical protein [Pseudonocardiaceae bacterium]
MAQRGSGRTGGKARPAGRGPTAGKNSSPGRGSASAGRTSKQTAAAAQRAIKGARGRSGSGVLVRTVLPIVGIVALAAAVIVGVLLSNHSNTSNGALPQGADTSTGLLANTAGQSTGDTVDGVSSNNTEQVLFHVHAHLAMYVNGQPKLLPYGLGIVPPYQLQQTAAGPFVAGGSKFYWLHTHDESGVIHIESPVQRTYTLGEFFDLWHQNLSPTQLGPNTGKITAFMNGKPYTGNPRDIPLTAHNVIQLDLGTVVPFANFSFPSGE